MLRAASRFALLVLVAFPLAPVAAGQTPAPRAEAGGPTIEVDTFRLESRVFGNTRTIRVLLPAGYGDSGNRDRRYPVLYMNDGFAVFKASSWDAPAVVRRLEAEGRIRPFLLVGVDNGATADNGSPDQRTLEYLPWPDAKNQPSAVPPRGSAYPDFLVGEVMPAVASRYRVSGRPEDTAVGGASLGGLAALYAVVHRPGVFGGLLLESTPLFLADFAALKEAKAAPPSAWPARVSIGIGTHETDDEALAKSAAPTMEELRAAIRAKAPATEVRLVVEPGGAHTPAAWRGRLSAALELLWPAAERGKSK
jgi:predicted alpha/beta superfamily hydrolase